MFLLIPLVLLCLKTVYGKDCVGNDVCQVDADNLEFFLLGDTGGLPIYPYRSYAQTRVAEAMVKLAKNKNASFVVNMGDSFYFNGVTDVMDKRFEVRHFTKRGDYAQAYA